MPEEKIELKCSECGKVNTFHIEGLQIETLLDGSKYYYYTNFEKELICSNCGKELNY